MFSKPTQYVQVPVSRPGSGMSGINILAWALIGFVGVAIAITVLLTALAMLCGVVGFIGKALGVV